MDYLLQRGNRFYYNRRIPDAYREFDPRNVIRVTLKTDSRTTARKLAMAHNERLESYWKVLAQKGEKHSDLSYKIIVDRARTLGFIYYPNAILANAPLNQIVERIEHVEKSKFNDHQTEAILGGIHPPVIRLQEVLPLYFRLSKDRTLNKSPNQKRKWENPRKKAIRNFITCIGNKPISEVTREDALCFRDWWIQRIEHDGLISSSADKDFMHVKTIITCVTENLKIDLDTAHIFRKLSLNVDDGGKRLPLESSHIVSTLLNLEKLKGLNEQARWVLYAFAETGAGLNELTGLLPEDVFLNGDIPHIYIRPRKGHTLKTKFRERKIPLVGFALDAFRACPQGFTNYHDRPDSLSTLLSQYLKDHKLLPSDQHTVYSLRHSFQDRLLVVNTPDRVQADLMGHKFQRPAYGEGATLAHKLEWMQKIQLKMG